MTTHGAVAGSMRKTIDNLREANAGLLKRCDEGTLELLAENERHAATTFERDALRQRVEELELEAEDAALTGAQHFRRAEAAEAENTRLREALSRAINSSRQYAQVDRKERNYAFHMLMLRECEDVLNGRAPSQPEEGWGYDTETGEEGKR